MDITTRSAALQFRPHVMVQMEARRLAETARCAAEGIVSEQWVEAFEDEVRRDAAACREQGCAMPQCPSQQSTRGEDGSDDPMPSPMELPVSKQTTNEVAQSRLQAVLGRIKRRLRDDSLSRTPITHSSLIGPHRTAEQVRPGAGVGSARGW